MPNWFIGALVCALVWNVAITPSSGSEIANRVDLGQEHSLDISYGGRLFGFTVVKVQLSAAFVGESYAARAEYKSSGLAAIFRKMKVVASTSGQIINGKLRTREYWHKELDGRKNRELSMSFATSDVSVRADPPLHSMGDPAASMAQRLEAVDPVTGILTLASYASSEPKMGQCTGTLRIFDGKQRYDLRLEAMGLEKVRTRAYRGEALRCNAWYIPVAGFDADDLVDPDEYSRPVVMWLADVGNTGIRVPVRFEARLDFGRVVVDARRIEIK